MQFPPCGKIANPLQYTNKGPDLHPLSIYLSIDSIYLSIYISREMNRKRYRETQRYIYIERHRDRNINKKTEKTERQSEGDIGYNETELQRETE